MFLSKNRHTRSLRLTGLALAAALAGCSLNPFAEKDDPIVNDAPRTSQGPGSSSSLDPAASSSASRQTYSAPVMERTEPRRVPLAENHPDQYTVQHGDTLWDIASRFLKDPWYWPEVWYINPQVENPHLIYPGDVLALVTIDGEQRITNMLGSAYRLAPQARVTQLDETISTIPYEEISAFLSRGLVLEKGQADELPYILATRGDHMIAAAGNDVYVRGGNATPSGTRYSVVKVGDALVDPDDGKTVGYQGIYIGDGIMARGGDPATVSLTDTNREALPGDRLLPESLDIPLNFFPKAPNTNVDGRIISVVDGVSLIGQYQVVVINRGAQHGLAPGDVLTVFQAGEVVRDRFSGRFLARGNLSGGERVRLPDEEAGTVMVFKVYDRIGYGLVMEATSDIHVLDAVRNPI
ncbi:MAG: LysM peptidoglycan-binding domain-containing protein [Gammaproteobacteria bacterium]|nr:LysM peptidoglycan-binding domain-containing protein [Gammaproteobacteria bacterium]MDH4254170.1 LysM peptidoglycan-binding domain-containing protein [Gammaproteobacteria bacterium]MDH5309964.1 LysM peptidoglycan-binding domain-containing protein [Gammaproteobacteria bacterium]